MYKVDLWVWVDDKSPEKTRKGYAYSLEASRKDGTVKRTAVEGEIEAGWHRALLYAITEALGRFNANAEIRILTDCYEIADMITDNLDEWEWDGFGASMDGEAENEDLWREIAVKRHSHKISAEYLTMDRSRELMEHAIGWGRKDF